ncbi:small multi-drug export protein [Saccharibacillus sp. JS10]|uniref:small multi-drug export protein n=1 Tax=Saccharibacillus sp. JS10 TaxID=2950552 RepID=UPI00210C11CA|nr:small multi-drug export protein [Saccharibacillus sp. JS10]MCQ4086614.1 small multi-drug export protein [Saccharibacillus sp. JS10]
MDISGILESVRDANVWIQMGAVFLLSLVPFLEGYIAAAVGIAIGFPAIATILAATLGNWVSVMAVVVLYDKIGKYREGKASKKSSTKRMEKARALFSKYGVPGVALIGPLAFGHHLGALISLLSGAPKRYVTLWMTIGIIVWTVGAGVLVLLGVNVAGNF